MFQRELRSKSLTYEVGKREAERRPRELLYAERRNHLHCTNFATKASFRVHIGKQLYGQAVKQ